MSVRVVVILLTHAVLLVSGPAWASTELPGFTIHAQETAGPDEQVHLAVTPVDGAWLYVHPLDRLVGLFEIDDLDDDLRPVTGAGYRTVELVSDGDGGFQGWVSVEPGEYALVPYPDVVGELPAEGTHPEAVLLSVEPIGPPARSGGSTGWVLLAALVVAVAIPVLVSRWIRRRRDVDDYFERDFRDPPTLGGIWPNGGGFG